MNDRTRKWIKRSLIGIGTIFVLLPIVVIGVIQTGMFKDWLRGFAVEQANTSLNATLEIDEISGSLLGSLVIEGARLKGPDGELLASIERAEADYEIWDALSGELEIDELMVEGASVRLVQDAQGLNFARIVKPTPDEPETPPPDFRIILPDIRLTNSTVSYADTTRTSVVPRGHDDVPLDSGAPAASAFVSELSLEGKADLDLAGTLSATIERLGAEVSVSSLEKGQLEAEMLKWTLDPQGVQRASLAELNLLDLISLSQVATRLETDDESLLYAVDVGNARIAPEASKIAERLELGFGLAVPLELGIHATGDSNSLQTRLHVSTETQGSIQIAARLTELAAESPAYDVSLVADDLRAHEIVTQLELPRHQLNLWASASGKGFDPKTLTADARIGLLDSRFDDYFIQYLYLEGGARDGRLVVERMGVDTPYFTGHARGFFDQNTEEFSLRVLADSEDELSKLTGGGLESESKLEGLVDASGQLDLQAESPMAMLVDAKIKARWDISEFSAETIRIDDSRGTVNLEIDALGPDERRVKFDIDVRARRAKFQDYRVRSLDLRGVGSTTISLPIDNPGDVLRRANLELNADVQSLKAPGIATIERSRVDAKIDAMGTRTYRYDVDAELANVSLPGVLETRKLDIDLKGVLGLDSDGTRPTRLDAQGSIDLEETSGFGQSVGAAQVKVDVQGPTRNLKGTINLTATDAEVPQYDFETLQADLLLEGKRQFILDVNGKPKSGTPESIDLKVRGSYSADLTTFEVDDVNITGAGKSWIIENGLVAQTSDGTYRFRDLQLTHGDDQRVTLDGVFRPGKDQDLTLEIENLAITELPREFGFEVPPIRGRVNGTVQVDGSSKKPRGYVDLTLTEIYYEGYGPFTISIKGLYEDDRLYISQADVTAYEIQLLDMTAIVPIHVTLDGEFEVLEDEDFSLLTTIVPFEMEEFHDPIPVLSTLDARGQIAGEIAFFGSLSNPYMETQLNLDDAEVSVGLASGDNVQIGPVRVVSNIKYAPLGTQQGGFRGAISLRDRNNDGFQARAAAQVPLEQWLTYAARGELDKIKAEDWMDAPFELLLLLPSYDISKVNVSAAREAKAEGEIDVYVQAQGTMTNPNGIVRARLADFGWGRYRDIYVDLDMEFGNEKLSINNFLVNWDAADIIKASATLPVPIEDVLEGEKLEDLPLNAQVQLLEIPIAKLSAIDFTFAAITGSIQADIKLAGSLNAPQLDGTLQLEGVTFADGRPGSIEFDIGARRNRLTANATLTHNERKSLSFSAGLPMNLNFISLAQGEDFLTKGPLSGSLFAQDLPVASMIPRRILDSFMQDVGGTLNTDLTLRGNYETPVVSGSFKLMDFEAFFPGLGRTIDEGNIHVTAKSNAIEIVELYAREGNGYIDADGEVVLSNFQPQRANLKVTMKELSTSGFSPLPAYVTGNAVLDADLTTEIIDTTVTLRDLDIAIPDTAQAGTHPLELSADVEILNPRERERGLVQLEQIESALGERSQLAKVQVKIEPNSWVHHPNADIQFRGDLALDVGRTDTVILGDISTVDGKLEFLGKEFAMRQGIVTFAGNTPPNPRLQVEAVYTLDRSITEAVGPATSGEPKAVVRVTGPARNPQLRLSSDPQMTESQIIYVLVTDRPPADPNQEQGVAGQAVAAASGLLSGMLKQRAAKYTPIDTFRLTTDNEGVSGVELGRYFGKNLFFAYQYQFAAEQGENISEFRLEYTLDFAPSWLVGTRFGDQGNGAVFIFWDVL